jgi:radical SAM protein with 4Fe4S-binding SPASM domain
VYPCGYLPVSAGSVRTQPFGEIWKSSHLFEELRDADALTGKCGICRFEAICGGCRARAYYETGDYPAGEPFCTYEPDGD